MKRLLLICLFALSYYSSFGQTLTQNINNRLIKKDDTRKVFTLSLANFNFSSLFLHTDNSVIYGFIGNDYQRLRMKLLIVTKSDSKPDTYVVYGKSMVKNNVCEFDGTLTISNVLKYKTMSYGVDSSYYNKGIKGEYVILGSYNFSENKNQPHSGIFKGVFQSNFYLDKNNKIHYDDIDDIADGFTNNQFIGQWAAYKGNVIKRCNWGDFRIPNSGNLDIGAGGFSPDDRYLKYGWQSIRNLIESQNNKNAQKAEDAKWWQ